MFIPRVLSLLVVAAGLVLGAIGVVAVPAAALGAVWIGVFVGGLASLRSQWMPAGPGPRIAAVRRRVGRRNGFVAGGAAVAGCLMVTGVVVLLGPVGGVVTVMLVLVAGPLAWLWLGRRHRLPRLGAPGPGSATHHGEPAVAAPPPPVGPETLSTKELCLAWRGSYFALLDVHAGAGRDEIVRLREGLLNELERRDRDGFARWLETGARADGDPSRYLATDR